MIYVVSGVDQFDIYVCVCAFIHVEVKYTYNFDDVNVDTFL